MHEKLREFVALAREADRISKSDASWETKYEIVFSEEISLRMEDLGFNWDDPDTSYELDVLAFCHAAMEKADDIERAIGVHPDASRV